MALTTRRAISRCFACRPPRPLFFQRTNPRCSFLTSRAFRTDGPPSSSPATKNTNTRLQPLDPTKLPLRVCIVGSGPAGFYTAEALLKEIPHATVDILEQLPSPYGLVRYGVAPDHPEVKLVTEKFEVVAQHEQVNFLGNVKVGEDISIEELRALYNAVILAYGAEDDKLLGIPGENLPGVYSARDFVSWYNGHPYYRHCKFDLQSDKAVIIGQGNVALDVARILLQSHDDLKRTDISEDALRALQNCPIREVHIVGRRGPAQAAFTTKELRELFALPNCDVVINPKELVLNPASQEEVKHARARKRQLELLLQATSPENAKQPNRLVIHFLKAPQRFEENHEGRASGVELVQTRLEGPPGNQRSVLQTESGITTLSSSIFFRSIGYTSRPIPGIPFDTARGIISNFHGRVVLSSPALSPVPAPTLPEDVPGTQVGEESISSPPVEMGENTSSTVDDMKFSTIPNLSDNTPQDEVKKTNTQTQQQPANPAVPGLYVAGWIKRGPSGIIATNRWDAQETVMSLLEDWQHGRLNNLDCQSDLDSASVVRKIVEERGKRVVSFADWKVIDNYEVSNATAVGRSRLKITSIEEMLALLPARNK